ncbi:MAG: hypothetical protein ACI3VN_04445 [Candidatus Onthomonas sp.]
MEQKTCTGAGCGSCCHSCGSCGNQDSLYLTPSELELLKQLAVTPFLPAGFNSRGRHPICLDCPGDREAVSDTLVALGQKRLISLDPEIPLQGFDYAAYEAFPLHGSLALTALGQQVLELLEIQGAEE